MPYQYVAPLLINVLKAMEALVVEQKNRDVLPRIQRSLVLAILC
jgi:hypothetical protein